ncbi:unnamed protein product [Brassica rapa subsp. narinosa]
MHKMCHEPINVSPVESGVTFNELDHLPLTTRRSLLQPNAASNVDSVVKREEDCFDELGAVVPNCDAPESVNTQTPESTSIGCSQGLIESGNSRPQNNILLVSCRNNRFEQIEETTGSDDALEHLSLKERRKLLLERMVLRLPEPNLEDNTKDCHETDLFKIKAENSCKNGIASSSAARFSGFLEKIDSFLYKKVSIGSVSESQLSGVQENDIPIANKRSFELSPEASLHSDYEHSPLSSTCYAAVTEKQRDSVKRVKRNPRPLNVSEMQLNQDVCEPLDDSSMDNNEEPDPVTSEQVQVKREVETHEEDEIDFVNLISRMTRCASAPSPASFVKDEASELDEDEIDHMKLIDRLKLRSSSNGSGHHEAPPSSSPPSGFSFCTSDEYVKPVRVSKRKKTATNSIETALEEDAPGLLQVLIKQGVTVDELRLYGENDSFSDDSSLLEETFSELEDVISQLYFKRATGPKLLNLSFSKDSRTSYCLTCLFSLIEQARYLRFRKWPVEWGWCRDLQSFIFVFERHNRIVMERPEYGYATYFFELSNTASVGWQIKRLVLAMKLASCGRYQLIENKPLLVGEDMTEGEAEVLMKYGWVANTGLGTMLNYRDRVFHDRKSHKETSEWKSKISKLLVDGYNSGTIVSTFIVPPDDVEDDDDAGLDMEQVKLESY